MFYRIDSSFFSFEDGLMLRRHRIGRCGGSRRLHLEPLWFGGKPRRSYHKDQLASFLDELKPVMPTLPRHFPLNATWKLTPEEQEVLDKFNNEYAHTLTSLLEKDARLLVLKSYSSTVWVQDGKFVVGRWSDTDEKWKVVDEKTGLKPEQAEEAVAEWRWRAGLLK